jgi:hypothetical protein
MAQAYGNVALRDVLYTRRTIYATVNYILATVDTESTSHSYQSGFFFRIELVHTVSDTVDCSMEVHNQCQQMWQRLEM